MSNAIGQSATAISVSPSGEKNYDYNAAVQRVSCRALKGMNREQRVLDVNKLTSAVCADYRAHFCSIYGRTERLPADIFNAIQDACYSYIGSRLQEVTPQNVISYRRFFHYHRQERSFTERTQLTSENLIPLKEQLFGAKLQLGVLENKLTRLQAKKTPDYDAESKCKSAILDITATITEIAAKIKSLEPAEQVVNEELNNAEK